MEQILSMEEVTKHYSGIVALNHVSLELKKGEIHALVGENGAGKSTLIKTLSGAVIPDAGTITIEGKSYTELTPSLSKELGIAIVYQELNLCSALTVYENIYLGSFKGKFGFVNREEMRKGAAKLLEENQIDINPDSRVSTLSVAYMQMVEIAKAVSRNVKILVLDEPTAPLTLAETDILFQLMRRLKAQGTSIIYISHRISEIFEVSDRVTIMRDGNVISTHLIDELNEAALVKGMIGRELTKTYPERSCKIGETVLKVEHLYGDKVRDINFEVHSGEILGLGGLVGAGRTELIRNIFAADPKLGGHIYLNGTEINPKNPREAVALGISLVPEDRKAQGVVLGLPITNNVCLSIYPTISKCFLVNRKKENQIVQKMIEDLQIKTPGGKMLAGNLSGGNQQKVVLAKCLAANSRVLILDEPTRGIDVGAKAEFYKLINELAARGLAIVMISSEMDELIGISDRIVVLNEGEQNGILEKPEFSQENIFKYAAIN